MVNLTTFVARVILVMLCVIVLIMEGEEEMVGRKKWLEDSLK